MPISVEGVPDRFANPELLQGLIKKAEFVHNEIQKRIDKLDRLLGFMETAETKLKIATVVVAVLAQPELAPWAIRFGSLLLAKELGQAIGTRVVNGDELDTAIVGTVFKDLTGLSDIELSATGYDPRTGKTVHLTPWQQGAVFADGFTTLELTIATAGATPTKVAIGPSDWSIASSMPTQYALVGGGTATAGAIAGLRPVAIPLPTARVYNALVTVATQNGPQQVRIYMTKPGNGGGGSVNPGNLKKVDNARLKQLGVDAEAFKEDWVGPDLGGTYNIATGPKGEVYLVPVNSGASAPIPTGYNLTELPAHYPLAK